MEFRAPPISPLRQRMLEDMGMRKFQPHTQTGDIRAVLRLTHFLERAPGTAAADDLSRFQVRLPDDGATPSTINATLRGLTRIATPCSRRCYLPVVRDRSIVRTPGMRRSLEIAANHARGP